MPADLGQEAQPRAATHPPPTAGLSPSHRRPTSVPGSTSSTEENASCSEDVDCKIGHCVDRFCSAGRNGERCNLDEHCESRICVYGVRCYDGSNGAPCELDDDCLSRRCAGNAALSECTSGAPGANCLEGTDCASERCIPPPGKDPINTFGACD